MFAVIVAMTKDGGIGLDGGMAWKCKEELKLFKEKTMGAILVMGRKTVESLPHLPGREIWCVTRDENLDTSEYKNNVELFTDLHHLWTAVVHARKRGRNVFCAGGAELYKTMHRPRWRTEVDEWHVSVMKEDCKCDTFVSLPEFDPEFTILKKKRNHTKFIEYVYNMTDTSTQEREYLNLLRKVGHSGVSRHGRNGETDSLFAQHLHFDLTKGFPLLTTKRMFWRGIVEELLFFLKGETDSKKLEAKSIRIWQGNTERKFLDTHGFERRKEGMMGPMYGFQWRNFGGDYNESTGRVQQTMFVNGRPPNQGVDQLKDVIDKIKNDAHSRRILLTDYNPAQARRGVLYPCHSLMIQFYVDGDYLDMYCFNRSSDLFLGLPFNIASSSLLLAIIAWTTGKRPRHFHLTLGDAHIYAEHFQAVVTQLKRIPITLPTLVINREVHDTVDIEALQFGDFVLQDYSCHPSIKAPMIA
jgi:dihydrofolate reductase/thymidylate synthase